MFDNPNELMKFIWENKDSNNWFTSDILNASGEDWKTLKPQFEYLMEHGFIHQDNLCTFTVLRPPK